MIRLRNTLDRPRIFWLTDGTSISIEGYGTSGLPEGSSPCDSPTGEENKLFILEKAPAPKVREKEKRRISRWVSI